MTQKNWPNDENVAQYLWAIGQSEPDILRQLREETASHRMAKMSISKTQGQLLSWLLKLINAKHYLELGVFTGYSCTTAALALPEDGVITACDISTSYTDIARSFWKRAGIEHKISLHLQPALFTLKELLEEGKNGFYDFVLIDADKPTTPDYYEHTLPLLRTGGLIMIDNILLQGRVLDNSVNQTPTPSIEIMRSFNQQLNSDTRVNSIALPMGDGTILLQKIV